MAEGKGSKKKLFMMIGLVVLVLGGVGGAYMMGKKSAPAAANKGPSEKEKLEGEIVADSKGGEGEAKEGEAKEGGEAKPAGGHGGGHGGGEAAAEGGEKKSDSPSKSELKTALDFTVNLLDPRSRWFIQTTIEVYGATAAAKQAIDDNDAPLRDATITLLSSKTREEVSTPEGKERLKRELMARFEGLLPPHTIEEIYLTKWVVTTR